MARPTKYRKEYCQQIIDHMTQGLSKESFAGIIGTHKQTIYNWMEVNEQFLDAVHRGEELCRLFWEKAGIRGMDRGKDFNAIVWKFNVANRFGWKEKSDVTSDDKPVVAGFIYNAPKQGDKEDAETVPDNQPIS